MTRPRRVVPGATVLLTRRCTERRFLLVPRDVTPKLFRYLVALTAKRHGLLIHAVSVMTNHYHILATDMRGCHPDFARDLDSMVARALNAEYGRSEAVWSSRGLNTVEVIGQQAVWDKLVYTIANPVAAGLVRTPADWPGFRTLPRDIATGPIPVRRPTARWFRTSRAPKEATLELTIPPALSHLEPDEFRAELTRRVGERVAEIRAQMKREKRSFMGRRRVMKQPRDGKPKKPETHFGRVPAIACKDPTRRKQELKALREFLTLYAEARERWLDGDAEVLFPFGTFEMVRLQGARCPRAPPETDRAA